MSDKDFPVEVGMIGGFGDVQPANPEVQAIADQVKPDFLNQSGVNATTFVVQSFREQVVAGSNYIMKVLYADNTCAHIRMFVPLPYTNQGPSLVSFQLNKTLQNNLAIF